MENKYKFDIEYPTQIEKQNSINFILDQRTQGRAWN